MGESMVFSPGLFSQKIFYNLLLSEEGLITFLQRGYNCIRWQSNNLVLMAQLFIMWLQKALFIPFRLRFLM